MEFLTNTFYLYPVASGTSVVLVVLAAALFLALAGGRKLFGELAAKNRAWSLIGSFVWYVILFFYFSAFFYYALLRLLLPALGLSEYLISRMDFEATDYVVGLFLLFLFGGATALLFFAKKQAVQGVASVALHRVLWRGTRFGVVAALFVFLAIAVFSVPAAMEQEKTEQKTEEQIVKIRATKLTLVDVMGDNLPPPPDPALVDATVAGVDANQNGIRDDVELAIFEEYPDSARIRAAFLQNALNYQLEMTLDLVNPGTVTAVAEEGGRAASCLGIVMRDYIYNRKGKTSQEIFEELSKMSEEELEEMSIRDYELGRFVEKLQYNTSERMMARKQFYEGNLRSYGDSPVNEEDCDIDLEALPN